MPRLNYKRGRFLLTAGVAQAFLGLSYAVSTTPARAEALGWLPLHSRGLGALIVLAGLLAILGAFRSARSVRWDVWGWRAAIFPPSMLGGVWFVVGLRTLLDENTATTPWSPWASVLVYAAMSILILVASDWPNPQDVTRPWGDAAEKGEGA